MIINNKFLVMIGLKPTTPWSKFHYRIILGSSFQQQSVQKSSFSSSSSGAAASTQVKSILKQPASVKHGEEIQQESLKTTIQSAITDIEQGMYRTTLTDGTGVTESGWNNRLVSLIMYSRVRNKHMGALINFWGFSRDYVLIKGGHVYWFLIFKKLFKNF